MKVLAMALFYAVAIGVIGYWLISVLQSDDK